MRFPPALLDEIRARLSVSQMVGRKVKLKRAGREFVGLSPFKQEKTPSFTVNDQKGFYHCFATGEHGDIFTFLMKTEGLSFPESVERLANETGVPMPKSTPEAVERAEKNDRLREITEHAAQFFSNCLQMREASHAQNYLQGRGITPQQVAQFRLGFAPNSRDALKRHLMDMGYQEHELIASGMLIGGPDISVSYDRFRDRIMFPIADGKQRVIAFGGRALSETQKAKYLNSPETPLFHKGHQLYNASFARQAAYVKKSIIVTEGYMDVIAMAGAGFEHTVAPLGTALTSNQLQLLWRMAQEPILCFDGDSAGQKAAFRAVETALPLLKPGFSLKFTFLPDGQDPDDLLKTQGAREMQALLESAKPLSQVLWEKEYALDNWQTPERKAALEQSLFQQINSIEDQTVRSHYVRAMKSQLWQAFQKSSGQSPKSQYNKSQFKRSRAASKGGQFNQNAKPSATSSLMTSPLLQNKPAKNHVHEAVLLVTLMEHPWLLETEDEHISSLKFTTPMAEKLRKAILEAHFTQNSLDREAIQSHLEKLNLSSAAHEMHRTIAQNGRTNAEPDKDPNEVREEWHHLMMRHHKAEELKQELEAAERAYMEEENQQNFERLKVIQQALEHSLNEMI